MVQPPHLIEEAVSLVAGEGVEPSVFWARTRRVATTLPRTSVEYYSQRRSHLSILTVQLDVWFADSPVLFVAISGKSAYRVEFCAATCYIMGRCGRLAQG